MGYLLFNCVTLLYSSGKQSLLLIVVALAFIGMPIHGFGMSGPPTLSYWPAISDIPVVQGSQNTDVFTFKSQGSFQGTVALSIAGLPNGMTATWSKNPVALLSDVGSSTLTLAASKNLAANWYKFTVTASGANLSITTVYVVEVENAPGVQFKDWIPSLTMHSMDATSFDVEAMPLGGVTIPAGAAGATASIVSGLPKGITSSWIGPTMTASGGVMWTLTLAGSVNAVGSSGTLNLMVGVIDAVTGRVYTAVQSLPLTISMVPPTLTMSPLLTHVPVKQGEAGSDQFSFLVGGSFHGQLALSISGLPSGVTGSWSSSDVALNAGTGSSTLTLVASPTAVVNWFHFTVTASGDGLTVSNVYTVEVEPLYGVRVTLSNTALTIEPKGSATLTVTATPINGVILPARAAGASASIVSALPSGVTASWSAPTVTSAGAAYWTLSFNADASVRPLSDPLQLAIQITDLTSGTVYTMNTPFDILASLLANISVGSIPSVTIPSTFMGLAHEWGDAQTIMGDTSKGVNKVYRQLLSNLTSYGSGPINLRIGGNSTDSSGPPTDSGLTPFADLAKETGSTFELGVNLGANNVDLATEQATAYMGQMPVGSIEALEIGNEPDWYSMNGLRPTYYSVQDYYSDFNTWQHSILAATPTGTKLMGASWAVTTTLSNAATFESDYGKTLGVFSQHFYITSPASHPAADWLLTSAAATEGASWVEAAVATTHSFGIPFRIGELNSISVGGVHGISDAFGAALWSVDAMFEFAKVGVDGVNWQTTSCAYYSAFCFNVSEQSGVTSYSLNSLRPLYYGMLLFQASTSNGAKILPTIMSTSANLKTWATLDATGITRVVIIDKDETASGTVSVTVPGASQGSVLRLTAPSYTSLTGVTFAGQTLDGSPDGTLQGTQMVETINGTNGVFQLPMASTSAALIIFK